MNNSQKIKIRETIVVEGRDDTCAVKQAVDAETIETHGFGMTAATEAQIRDAYERKGIIILTDPDHAGGKIRRRLLDLFPEAKEAFIDRAAATLKSDVGVENAKPEAIIDALTKVCSPAPEGQSEEFTTADMAGYGLSGRADSVALRTEVGRELGIGYGNGRAFLRRLNHYGISRDSLEAAIVKVLKK